MTERRRGLGRGLGALIPTRTPDGDNTDDDNAPEHGSSVRLSAVPRDFAHPAHADPGSSAGGTADGEHKPESDDDLAYFIELPVGAIRPNPRQPRQAFDEEALAELAHSLREVGMLQPVVVRELPAADSSTPNTGDTDSADADSTDGNGSGDGGPARRYELVMGERRLRAARVAGLDTIPAIVRRTNDDALLRDALLENLHRAQLNPLEEAAAYDQLLADFGCTQEELAQRIGRSRPAISNTLRLLRLPPEVQRRVAAGVLSAGHARALLGVEDVAGQERLAQRIVAEGLSVRTVEELVALGELGPAERAPRRQHAPVAPALADLSARLSDRFETRVKVDLGKRKGKITIEFASIADLERIVAELDPRSDAADLAPDSADLAPDSADLAPDSAATDSAATGDATLAAS